VPTKLWKAILEGRKITRDDLPAIPDLIRSDGFVDLGKLCSLGAKRIDDIKESKPFKKFAVGLARELKIEVIIHGFVTWIHPRLADFVAFHSSVEFALSATAWMDAAKKHVQGVSHDHRDSMNRIATDNAFRIQKEHRVRDKLQSVIGGDVEVVGRGTRSDIVTNDVVVEVKHAKCITSAAHAIGQVVINQKVHPDKSKRVHLFGTEIEVKRCQESKHLLEFANDNGVSITFETILEVDLVSGNAIHA
jgi:hypothetical protein